MFKEGQPQPDEMKDKEMSRRNFLKKAAESKTPEINIARRIPSPEKKKIDPIEAARQKLEQYRQEHTEENFSPYYVVVNASKTEQKLYFFDQEKTIAIYPISTAQKGNSKEEIEETTPLGIHKVIGILGHDLPSSRAIDAHGSKGYDTEIIRSRGEFIAEMTSRILFLEGLENNNQQTFGRGIFIHGTN